MTRSLALFLSILTTPLWAKESLAFKKELIVNAHWLPYGLVVIVLIVALLILAKKTRQTGTSNPACKVIEKISVHHKTKVFVIEYQKQRFLIADNQNSLAIHPVQEPSLEDFK